MKCTQCLKGRPWECEFHGDCDGRILVSVPVVGSIDLSNDDSSHVEGVSTGYEPGKPEREINVYKDDAVVRDQQSTGRKRAADMYPLYPEYDCEWRMQKGCGGGKYPIIGCLDGKQEARHHGPDKNTLNNEEGNVHRICHKCHNRWHHRNDEGYVWGAIYTPHSGKPATEVEVKLNDISWTGYKVKNVKD